MILSAFDFLLTKCSKLLLFLVFLMRFLLRLFLPKFNDILVILILLNFHGLRWFLKLLSVLKNYTSSCVRLSIINPEKFFISQNKLSEHQIINYYKLLFRAESRVPNKEILRAWCSQKYFIDEFTDYYGVLMFHNSLFDTPFVLWVLNILNFVTSRNCYYIIFRMEICEPIPGLINFRKFIPVNLLRVFLIKHFIDQ